MISWWWLLVLAPVAFVIGYLLAIRSVIRAWKKSIDKPDSPIRKFLDPAIEVMGRQTFETAAQVAEAHQMVTKCPQNCGKTIADGIREVVIKSQIGG